MKKQRGRIWLRLLTACFILALFAGCGQIKDKGEENGIRSKVGETNESKAYHAEETSAGSNFEESAQRKEDADDSDGSEMEAEEQEMSLGVTEDRAAMAVELPEEEENAQSLGLIAEVTEETVTEEAESMIEAESHPEPYYLTESDKAEVLVQLAAMGEQYGLTYYPTITEGETWDSPTPIYEEELILGRDHVLSAMVEYTEGAFVLMQMEGCRGFALGIKEQPDTVTGAYYEVYVYWV